MANRLHVCFKEYALDATKFFPFKELPKIILERCRAPMLPKISKEKENVDNIILGEIGRYLKSLLSNM